jgi:hypothetical protein
MDGVVAPDRCEVRQIWRLPETFPDGISTDTSIKVVADEWVRATESTRVIVTG